MTKSLTANFNVNFYATFRRTSLTTLKDDSVTRKMPIYKSALGQLLHVRHSDGHTPKEDTLINAKNDDATELAAAQRRFLRLFAINDIAGIATCYAEDAQMLVANMEVIVGRASIQSVFKFTAVQGHVLEFQTQEVDIHGTTAVEIGSYTRKRRGGSIFDRGKYMVVWKRVAGTWLIHRDMFSTSLAKSSVLTAA